MIEIPGGTVNIKIIREDSRGLIPSDRVKIIIESTTRAAICIDNFPLLKLIKAIKEGVE